MNYSSIRAQQLISKPASRANRLEAMYVGLQDSSQLDPMGRLRVSSSTVIFASKQIYSYQPLLWDHATTGSGSITYNQPTASSTLAINGAGTAIRQTRRRFVYEPGRSLSIFRSVNLKDGDGATKRIGYFDENNGIFLEQLGGRLYFVKRSSVTGAPVDSPIGQDEWNVDRFNGLGLSGVKLDPTKIQIVCFDFEWHGAGRVRCGFLVDGKIQYAHEFLHANYADSVYMSTPNLPIRVELTGNAVVSFDHISAAVSSDGGYDIVPFDRAVDSGITPLSTNLTTLSPLISIRLKSSAKGAAIFTEKVDLLCTTTATFKWALLLNPVVVGGSLSFTGVADSVVEYSANTNAALSLTGGHQLASGYAAQGNAAQLNLNVRTFVSPGFSIGGNPDFLCLAVQKITGATESFYGSLRWLEFL